MPYVLFTRFPVISIVSKPIDPSISGQKSASFHGSQQRCYWGFFFGKQKKLAGSRNPCTSPSRWLNFSSSRSATTLEHRKGSANGSSADFPSRLHRNRPAAEHDRAGSGRLTPVEERGLYTSPGACGQPSPPSPVPSAGSSGPVPRPESDPQGWAAAYPF